MALLIRANRRLSALVLGSVLTIGTFAAFTASASACITCSVTCNSRGCTYQCTYTPGPCRL